MDVLGKMSNVDLSELLFEMVEEDLCLKMKPFTQETEILGTSVEQNFVKIIDCDADVQELLEFLKEWRPLYEKLSMYNEFYTIRSETALKDSYNVAEMDIQILLNDTFRAPMELFSWETRGEMSSHIEESALEKMDVSQRKLHYLAVNTLSTEELYKEIEQKMQQYVAYCSDQTNKKFVESFEIIYETIRIYKKYPDQFQILSRITEELNDLYHWMKAIITTIRLYLYKNKGNEYSLF